MRPADVARLLALAAIWGGSFIFMRVLAPALGPVVTADARGLIAGVVLCVWFALTRFDLEWRRRWWQYCVIGTVGSAFPFVLYSYAALHLPASYSAIFNASAPLFGAVFGAVWLAERLTAVRLLGMALGLGGVVLVSRTGAFTPRSEKGTDLFLRPSGVSSAPVLDANAQFSLNLVCKTLCAGQLSTL